MFDTRHIVFPFDFSAQGRKIVPFVRAHALQLRAHVSVVSVVPPPFMHAPPDMPIAPGDPAVMAAQLRILLAKELPKELADLDHETVALNGDPAYKIVEYARQHNAGMIMMPTHGTGLFRATLIGSVTSKVLHDAPCPVWTAAHAEEQQANPQPINLLCAVDDTPEATGILQWAHQYAIKMGAILRILHIVPPISDWLGLPSERDLQEDLRAAAREKISALLRQAAVSAPLTVAVGRVTEVIQEEVRQGGEDLIILGKGASQGAFAHLRSPLYSVIAASPCPVVTV